MIIDTKKTVTKFRFRSFIITILLLIAIVLFTQLINNELFGLSKKYYVFLSIAGYLFFFIWKLLLDRYYVFFCDEGKDLIFKYFPLRPLISEKKSIKIPKGSFYSFEIKSSFFNLKNKLILKQNLKNKIATYPTVNISIFTKEELESFRNSLKEYSKTKL